MITDQWIILDKYYRFVAVFAVLSNVLSCMSFSNSKFSEKCKNVPNSTFDTSDLRKEINYMLHSVYSHVYETAKEEKWQQDVNQLQCFLHSYVYTYSSDMCCTICLFLMYSFLLSIIILWSVIEFTYAWYLLELLILCGTYIYIPENKSLWFVHFRLNISELMFY